MWYQRAIEYFRKNTDSMIAETPEYLAQRLIKEGNKTIEYFMSLAPEEWHRKVYSDGAQWRVHQILAHFVASEIAFNRLISNILAGGGGSPEDFDINYFNERKVLLFKEVPNTDLLLLFEKSRSKNVSLIQAISPYDLERVGRHPFLGLAPLSDIIKLIYRHNQIHQRDIRRLISDDPL